LEGKKLQNRGGGKESQKMSRFAKKSVVRSKAGRGPWIKGQQGHRNEGGRRARKMGGQRGKSAAICGGTIPNCKTNNNQRNVRRKKKKWETRPSLLQGLIKMKDQKRVKNAGHAVVKLKKEANNRRRTAACTKVRKERAQKERELIKKLEPLIPQEMCWMDDKQFIGEHFKNHQSRKGKKKKKRGEEGLNHIILNAVFGGWGEKTRSPASTA